MAAIKRTKADFDAIGWLMCEQADAPHVDTLLGLIPFGDVEQTQRTPGAVALMLTGQGASVWRAELVRRATAAQKAAAKANGATTTEPPPAMAESRKPANDRPAPVGPGAGRA